MHFLIAPGRIYYNDADGKLLAEVTFPANADGVVHIERTFVDPSLRGQGVAGKLLRTLAEHLRTNGQRAIPVCSYAVDWFARHPEYRDLLAE